MWFQKPIPRVLFHGTLTTNLKSIRKHGIRAGSSERANFADFSDDVRGMVSLSDTKLAARRFAVYSLVGKPKGTKSDFVAVIVDTMVLKHRGVPVVPLRGKLSADYGGHEYRAVGSIPAAAIVGAFRYHDVKGKFTEEYMKL